MDKPILKCWLLLCLMGATPCVVANDTSFGGSGASPFPMQNATIEMLNEKITIVGQGLNQEGAKGRWDFSCDFTFKNTTNNDVKLRVGFPFPVSNEESNFAIPEGFSNKMGGALVYDFSVTIDGKAVEAQQQKISPNHEKGLNYDDAYLWDMQFQPLQTIKVHHQYVTGATFDVMGFNWVSYVLKTGGLWKGEKIGHTIVEVIPNTPTRMCSELDPKSEYLIPTPKGVTTVGEGKERHYRWDLQEFSPKEDVSLCLQTGKNYVHYRIVYPIVYPEYNFNSFALNKMSAMELKRLRNTIFAQYGRVFKDPQLQAYFDKEWWYEPNPHFTDAMLTDEDKKALKRIAQIK
jgi:hypothetical protein